MRRFVNVSIIFSLVIGLSFFNACSDVVDEDDMNESDTFLINEPIEESDTVYITINQMNEEYTRTSGAIENDGNDNFGLSASNKDTVAINLENPSHKVEGVQLNICDEDNYLTLLGCTTTERTTEFLCRAREIDNGCCSVSLFSTSPIGVIEEGTGPVFNLTYGVSEEAPLGECRNINTENVLATDSAGNTLEVISSPAEFCFSAELPLCEVTISPESAEVLPGDTILFSASTIEMGCNDPCYVWEVEGNSGSIIDINGLYTAGNIAGTDIVTVRDECNGQVSDTATITLLDPDNDGNEDNVDPNIVIDGCDSGVLDEDIDDVFTMGDLITVCENYAKNHGAFVSCVADLTNEWKKGGLITGKEKGAVQSCAAKANIP